MKVLLRSAYLFVWFLPFTALAEPEVQTLTIPKKSIEERLSDLEAEQTLNYFSFNGVLVSSYNDVGVEETYPVQRDTKNLDYWRLRFSLAANADINPQVKVYSRFTATKFFNRWREEGNSTVFNEDLEAAYGNTGSKIFLEKAYVDISPTGKPWTFSLGRLPTVHGSPANYWDMRPRMGTYALMSYNSPLDGIAMTYRLDSYLAEGHQWALRALYTPFSDVNAGTVAGNDSYIQPPRSDVNGTVPTGSANNTLIDLYSLQSDYSSRNFNFVDELGLIIQGYQLSSLPFSSGNGTSSLNITTRALTTSLEFLDIGHQGFDVSINYTFSQTESHGFFNGPGTGFGTDKESATLDATMALISARYRTDDWAVGYEWLESSKNSLYFSAASEDLTQFYRTNGVGHHLYLTRKLLEALTLRGGFRWQQYSNLPAFIGPITPTDREVKTLYVSLRTDF